MLSWQHLSSLPTILIDFRVGLSSDRRPLWESQIIGTVTSVSILMVEIPDSELIETTLFIFNHPIICGTTPEILKDTIAKVSRGGIYKPSELSRGGIYKTSIQEKILQNSQEVELINHHYRL